jgi:hypothetical protein
MVALLRNIPKSQKTVKGSRDSRQQEVEIHQLDFAISLADHAVTSGNHCISQCLRLLR